MLSISSSVRSSQQCSQQSSPLGCQRSSQLWSLPLGLLLLWPLLGCPTPSVAQSLEVIQCPTTSVNSLTQAIHTPQQQDLTADSVLQALALMQVVYLGETHDRAADHQAQLAIIQALHCRVPKLAIALEMFQRPAQPLLDRYLAGALTEQQLQQQTEFQQRWGFAWEFYAPILRFAKEKQIPLIALNAPSEVTRKVARQGFDALTPDQQQNLPPRSQIRLEPNRYRSRLQQIYREMHHSQGHGQGNSRGFENFFRAQVLWDETMAHWIDQTLQAQPDRLVVVLAGQGHLVYGDGIPSRVLRRHGKQLKQAIVLLNPANDVQPDRVQSDRQSDPAMPPVADYLWQTRSQK